MKYSVIKEIVLKSKRFPLPKIKLYKVVFPLLILLNLIGFAIGMKVVRNHFKDSQGKQGVKLVTFDRVSYEILKKLTKDVDNSDIYFFDGESLSSISKLNFFKKNKFLTANAVFIFDPLLAYNKNATYGTMNVYNIYNYLDINYNLAQGESENVIKNIYSKFYIKSNVIKLAGRLVEVLYQIDSSNQSKYLANFEKIKSDLDGAFLFSQNSVSRFNYRSVDVMIFGENIASLLKGMGFLDFIFIDIKPYDQADILQNKVNNAKNIIRSGQVRCIVNASGKKLYELERLASLQSIVYQNFDFEESFDINKYKTISDAIEKCFNGKRQKSKW